MYTVEHIQKKTTINELLKFYDAEKVNNDCKKCSNYKRIWSCPPHHFNILEWLNQYNEVELYLAKINLDPIQVKKSDVYAIFDKERRSFSDDLLAMENTERTAVIAGNCYQCKTCMRAEGKACILEDKMRYSLESLGFVVGDIASYCGVELMWVKEGIPPYLVNVGAIFIKK